MLLTFLIWQSGLIPCVETTGTISSCPTLLDSQHCFVYLFVLPVSWYLFDPRLTATSLIDGPPSSSSSDPNKVSSSHSFSTAVSVKADKVLTLCLDSTVIPSTSAHA